MRARAALITTILLASCLAGCGASVDLTPSVTISARPTYYGPSYDHGGYGGWYHRHWRHW